MGASPRPIEKVPARAARALVDRQQAGSSAAADDARDRGSILIRAAWDVHRTTRSAARKNNFMLFRRPRDVIFVARDSRSPDRGARYGGGVRPQVAADATMAADVMGPKGPGTDFG